MSITHIFQLPFFKPDDQFINIPFDAQTAILERIEFLQLLRQAEGINRLVIGLSGGIDSAVSLGLARLAFGAINVFAVLLPNGRGGKLATEYAKYVIAKFQIPADNVVTINVHSIVNIVAKLSGASGNIRLGNAAARARMIVLYDQAKKRTDEMFGLRAAVLGTENKTEHYTAYFTRGGDEITDIEPLRGLYKTQIFQLGIALGVPDEILLRVPTADLWQGQSDEGELGFSYQLADQILHLHLDAGMTANEIKVMGLPTEVVDAVLARMKNFAFKTKVPYTMETYGKK